MRSGLELAVVGRIVVVERCAGHFRLFGDWWRHSGRRRSLEVAVVGELLVKLELLRRRFLTAG